MSVIYGRLWLLIKHDTGTERGHMLDKRKNYEDFLDSDADYDSSYQLQQEKTVQARRKEMNLFSSLRSGYVLCFCPPLQAKEAPPDILRFIAKSVLPWRIYCRSRGK